MDFGYSRNYFGEVDVVPIQKLLFPLGLICAALIGFQASFVAVHQSHHAAEAIARSQHSQSFLEEGGCDLCLTLHVPLQAQSFEPVLVKLTTARILPVPAAAPGLASFDVALPEARAPPVVS